MSAAAPLAALERLPIAVAMRESLWLFPAVEIAHILGFVVLVGGVVVLDLRLLGLGRAVPVRALTRHVLPWSFGALLVIVPSGLLMFAAQASELIANRAFQVKLALLLLAAVNAGLFHTATSRAPAGWDTQTSPPRRVRLHAAASLAIWVSVIACGRLLAYV